MYLLTFYTFLQSYISDVRITMETDYTLSFMTSYLVFVQACPKPSYTVVLCLSMVHIVFLNLRYPFSLAKV